MGKKVSRDWVITNVRFMHTRGGRGLNIDSFPEPRGGYDTSMTFLDKEMFEAGGYRGKVKINLPRMGWVDCMGY